MWSVPGILCFKGTFKAHNPTCCQKDFKYDGCVFSYATANVSPIYIGGWRVDPAGEPHRLKCNGAHLNSGDNLIKRFTLSYDSETAWLQARKILPDEPYTFFGSVHSGVG